MSAIEQASSAEAPRPPEQVRRSTAAKALEGRSSVYDAAIQEEKKAQAELSSVENLLRNTQGESRARLQALVDTARRRIEEARQGRESLAAEVEGARAEWRADRQAQIVELRGVLDAATSRFTELEKVLADDADERRAHEMLETARGLDAGAVRDGLEALWEESFSRLVEGLVSAMERHPELKEERGRLSALSGDPAVRFEEYLAVKQETAKRLRDPEGLLDREKRKRERQKARLNRVTEQGRAYVDDETARRREEELRALPATDLSLQREKEEVRREMRGTESPSWALQLINRAELRKHNILQLVDARSLMPLEEVKKSIVAFSSYDRMQYLLAASGKKEAEAYFTARYENAGHPRHEYLLTQQMGELVRVLAHLPRASNYAYRIEGRELPEADVEAARAFIRHIDVVLPVLKVAAAFHATEAQKEQRGRHRSEQPALEWYWQIARILKNGGPQRGKEYLDEVYAAIGEQPGVPSREECEDAIRAWERIAAEEKIGSYERRTEPKTVTEEEYKNRLALAEGEASLKEFEASLLGALREIVRVESQRPEAEEHLEEVRAHRQRTIEQTKQALESARREWDLHRGKMDVFNARYKELTEATGGVQREIDERRRQIEENEGRMFKGGLIKKLQGEIDELQTTLGTKSREAQTYYREQYPRAPETSIRTLESDLRSAEQFPTSSWKTDRYKQDRDVVLRQVGEIIGRLEELFRRNEVLAAAHPEKFTLQGNYRREVRGLPSDWPHLDAIRRFYENRPPERLPDEAALQEADARAKALRAQSEAAEREARRLKKPWEHHY